MREIRWTHVLFAATMIALGTLGLARGDFTPIWSGVPRSVPARAAIAYLMAAVSLATGIGMLVPRIASIAARVLLASFVAWMLIVRSTDVVLAPTQTGTWWSIGDTAVMIAACAIVAGTRRLRIARALFGLGLVPFGLAHFTYLARTVSMVPAWLPWHLPIAVATGCAFIVAGLAIALDVQARLASALVAAQLAGFTIFVWGPVMARGAPTPSDWAETISSWTLTVAALVVVDSYRNGQTAVGRF